MTFDEYEEQAATTIISTGDEFLDLLHWSLGVSGESGEIAEKIKKIVRDKKGQLTEQDKDELAKEVGDVLWYLAILSRHLGYRFEDVANANLAKLKSRKERGKLGGSGDNR